MTHSYADASRCRLLVAITAHFRPERLRYLFDVLRTLSEFNVAAMEVHVITNATEAGPLAELDRLGRLVAQDRFVYAIDSFGALADPLALAWCHKTLLRDVFLLPARGFTHFVHLEDDIRLTQTNFQYWLAFREPLRGYRLFPAFIHVEYRALTREVVAQGAFAPNIADHRRLIPIGPYRFANLDNPHNAMFVMDREMATEHVASRSFDIVRSVEVHNWWQTVERAQMALCFEDIPDGYASRHVVGLWPETMVPITPSWIHHLPNNYADGERTDQLGRIPLDRLFV